MKLFELIKKLSEIGQKYGDLRVNIRNPAGDHDWPEDVSVDDDTVFIETFTPDED